jgi:cytoskeletal protein RodZ
MIAVLLLGVLLVLGVLGFGAYLIFRPATPPEPGQAQPEASAPPSPGDPSQSREPAPDTGSASSAVEGPSPGDTGDLESVARDYVDAVNDRDEAAATALTCERANPGTLFSVTEGREVRLGQVELLEGAVGTAQVRVGDGETALLLENQEDGWCVAI